MMREELETWIRSVTHVDVDRYEVAVALDTLMGENARASMQRRGAHVKRWANCWGEYARPINLRDVAKARDRLLQDLGRAWLREQVGL